MALHTQDCLEWVYQQLKAQSSKVFKSKGTQFPFPSASLLKFRQDELIPGLEVHNGKNENQMS
jgi:hypothetical protein